MKQTFLNPESSIKQQTTWEQRKRFLAISTMITILFDIEEKSLRPWNSPRLPLESVRIVELSTMASSKPRFFIVRSTAATSSDGNLGHHQPSSIVPLVPVDLLPEWIEIQGIPRRLTLEQTAGMTNLGSFAAAAGDDVLALRFLNVHHQDDAPADDVGGNGEERGRPGATTAPRGIGNIEDSGRSISATPSRHDTTSDDKTSSPEEPRVLTPPPMCNGHSPENGSPSDGNTSTVRPGLASSQHNPSNDVNAATSLPEPPRPHPHPPRGPVNPGVQKYCQEWCHHGTCSQGNRCRSRHSMPHTKQGLVEVGLSKLPPWYRETTTDKWRLAPVGGKARKKMPGKKKPFRAPTSAGGIRDNTAYPNTTWSWSAQRSEGADQDWEPTTLVGRAMEELKLADGGWVEKSDERDGGREAVSNGGGQQRRLHDDGGELLIDIW